jgi:hypothetical protein
VSIRITWQSRYAVVVVLTTAGFVLRGHGLERWAALCDAAALAVLIDPLIVRAARALRRRRAGG